MFSREKKIGKIKSKTRTKRKSEKKEKGESKHSSTFKNIIPKTEIVNNLV